MSEEFDNEQEQAEEETGSSLWEVLQREQQEEIEEEYAPEQEEQDEEIAVQDKLEKKLSAKMENMQKKFDQTLLRERIQKFEGEADELTLDMFKTVASDVKTLEDFDKAMNVVNKQAATLRKQAEEYRQKLEKQASDDTAAAWGTTPIGGNPVPRTPDYEEKLMERITHGDDKAAFEAIVGMDLPKQRE